MNVNCVRFFFSRNELPLSEGSKDLVAAQGTELSPNRKWWHGIGADEAFWGVIAVWALSWLSWAVLVDRFASPLPFADDYQFCATGDMTGEQPLTWARLWALSNEHRFPLTRLWFVLLGRAASWDFRVMHQVNLALVAFGALMLVLATRAVRGRSHLADAFLPLIVLTPLQYETLLLYTCAYNMALAV